MVPNELINLLISIGFDCSTDGYRITINRVELPDCKKTYNYYDLIPSFKNSEVFATFCRYDYRMKFKQQMKDFLIKEDRERKLGDILND
jgi:hypothetical protein